MVKSETYSTSEGASVNFLSTREHIPVVQLQTLQLMFVYLSHNEIYAHACMTMYIEGGNNIWGNRWGCNFGGD